MSTRSEFECHHISHLSTYDFEGNSFVSDAQVVLIADVPGDTTIQEDNARSINLIWNRHLILVEHHDAGDIEPVSYESHLRSVKVVAAVTGWDLPGLRATLNTLTTEADTLGRLIASINIFLEQGRWGRFCADAGEFTQLLSKASPNLRKATLEYLGLLNKGLLEEFREAIQTLIKAVKAEHRQKLNQLYEDSFQARKESLQKSIDEALKVHERVIVCLSGNFLFLNPRLDAEKYRIDDLMAYLSEKKYAVMRHKSAPCLNTGNREFK